MPPALTISSPTNPPTPVNVNTTFQTFGTVNPRTSTMSAYLKRSGGGTVSGAPVQPPANSNWAFQFTNLLAGTAYTLNVEANDGEGQVVEQVSITT
jgi:hypothetical protein